MKNQNNSEKILNDPIYGFINIPSGTAFDLIGHRYFQRLRRICQLGLTNFVYPGANHTRFQHALGATHLMELAIATLRTKGQDISREEEDAAILAILLHDIGHGPFSHALEHDLVEGVSHESLSSLFMKKLNEQHNNKLEVAIKIFEGTYHKRFLHQLVSSQLDMDRLDYLKRDSFFTGVSEGVIGYDRIIKMLEVVNDNLVIEAKGIYSIEKFLIARRLMYWQVYLHKTVISAEQLLVKILKRAKFLALNGRDLFGTPSLLFFLYNRVELEHFENEVLFDGLTALDHFSNLDDNDIFSAIKVWSHSDDIILSTLCSWMLNRTLPKIKISKEPFGKKEIDARKKQIISSFNIGEEDVHYFLFQGIISNNAYDTDDDAIQILYKDGKLMDITEASDVLNVSVLDKNVEKSYICYPR